MAQDAVGEFKLVVIGGSAGSLEVILEIIKNLPPDLKAVIVIVLHRKNENDSTLENLLGYKSEMPVREVEDKESIENNCIYLAPADYHLLFESKSCFALDYSEKVHYSRPSIDLTFESAAEVFGAKTMGILLSGANADGAKGLLAIKNGGGLTVAQNPKTADVSFMPQQAIEMKAALKIKEGSELAKEIIEFTGDTKNS